MSNADLLIDGQRRCLCPNLPCLSGYAGDASLLSNAIAVFSLLCAMKLMDAHVITVSACLW